MKGLFTISIWVLGTVGLPGAISAAYPGIERCSFQEETVSGPHGQRYPIEYTKIEISALPGVIVSVVAARYSAYLIDEVYEGNDGSYKLLLKRNEKKLTVYYGKTGEFRKEER